MLIGAGFLLVPRAAVTQAMSASTTSFGLLAIASAMTPVMFAYGGWQTASFMSGELVRPRRDLAIGLLARVAGVITVYLAVNFVCLHASPRRALQRQPLLPRPSCVSPSANAARC
jgi:APA family basic amino acid/polyamine antiporter